MTQYKLPELPYDPAALEPHLSGKLLELHHGKHHAAYVEGANKTIEKLAALRDAKDLSALPALERALAFHVSGHVLHSIYWRNMAPQAGGAPDGELRAAIDDAFGSFEAFRAQMSEAATSVMGSGWAALVWEPVARRVLVTQIHDHQANVAQGAPILYVIDAWEHAWYLQYQNRKAEYAKAIWNVANWADVADRFAAARRIDARLPGAAG